MPGHPNYSHSPKNPKNPKAVVTDIQRFSIHDGPGIRTLVFFKGCPLACRWCQNPETQDCKPAIGFYAKDCQGSFACADACAEDAILHAGFRIDQERCTGCGACVDACGYGALRPVGQVYSVEELLEKIVRDRAFYGAAGGVTFSGGEPTMHFAFLAQLVAQCRAAGIHTNIETSGLFHLETWLPVLAKLDLIYFDLKLMDDTRHREQTGVSNRGILQNARVLAQQGLPVEFRMPLVQGITDTHQNIAKAIDFLQEIGHFQLHVLPYHNMGEAKIPVINGPQPLLNLPQYPEARLQEVRAQFARANIKALYH